MLPSNVEFVKEDDDNEDDDVEDELEDELEDDEDRGTSTLGSSNFRETSLVSDEVTELTVKFSEEFTYDSNMASTSRRARRLT